MVRSRPERSKTAPALKPEEPTKHEGPDPDSIRFVLSTCIAFFSTSLVMVGEMASENNMQGLVIIGGSMFIVNVLMTRYHLRRVRELQASKTLLPLVDRSLKTPGNHDDVLERLVEGKSRKRESGKRSKRKTRHDIGRIIQESHSGYASPTRRKAAKKAKIRRKREASARTGGFAGLGMGTRFIRI